MIRTLVFGAIAGYVGKKLYDEGKLTEFKDDLVSRYHQVRDDISTRAAQGGSAVGEAGSPPITSTAPRHTATSAPIVN